MENHGKIQPKASERWNVHKALKDRSYNGWRATGVIVGYDKKWDNER